MTPAPSLSRGRHAGSGSARAASFGLIGRIDDARGLAVNRTVGSSLDVRATIGETVRLRPGRYWTMEPSTAFGVEGRVRTVIGDWSEINGVALQVDGKIVASGWTRAPHRRLT